MPWAVWLCQALPRAPGQLCSGCHGPVSPLSPQWHRMPTTQETDGFQVKRPGDVNVKCTLLLMLDHQVQPGGTQGAPRGGDGLGQGFG